MELKERQERAALFLDFGNEIAEWGKVAEKITALEFVLSVSDGTSADAIRNLIQDCKEELETIDSRLAVLRGKLDINIPTSNEGTL